jgi:anti-anti-sigma factor
MMRLADIQFSTRGRAMIARLVGELDMSNAADAGETVAERTPNEMLGLVLDLSELDHLDRSGIQLLYRLRENLRIAARNSRS